MRSNCIDTQDRCITIQIYNLMKVHVSARQLNIVFQTSAVGSCEKKNHSIPRAITNEEAMRHSATQIAVIANKHKSLIIPQIDFEKVTVEEEIQFLRVLSVELDVTENDAAKKGINFVARNQAAEATPMIRQLRASTVPMATGLKYICDQSKHSYTVDGNVVFIMPQKDS